MNAIYVENLTKQYRGGVRGLDGLSLTVEMGEIFSLLGQNGAGKSTLIHILTTYLKPTGGRAEVFGKDLYTRASEIRASIACVAQQTSIDAYLSLEENMMFQSRLYRIPREEAKARMNRLIGSFGLSRYLNRPVAACSGGVRRRLDIAMSMMSEPRILFLDEPTVGMDIQSRHAMWEMMGKIREDFGTTIFLTTHYLEEADRLSDTICIMRDGKDVIQGTPGGLRRYLQKELLKITFQHSGVAEQAAHTLSEVFAGRKVQLRDQLVLIPAENGWEDLTRAARYLLEQSGGLKGIEITEPDMEDVFMRLTGREEGNI